MLCEFHQKKKTKRPCSEYMKFKNTRDKEMILKIAKEKQRISYSVSHNKLNYNIAINKLLKSKWLNSTNSFLHSCYMSMVKERTLFHVVIQGSKFMETLPSYDKEFCHLSTWFLEWREDRSTENFYSFLNALALARTSHVDLR